jgi:hypothetical protein
VVFRAYPIRTQTSHEYPNPLVAGGGLLAADLESAETNCDRVKSSEERGGEDS